MTGICRRAPRSVSTIFHLVTVISVKTRILAITLSLLFCQGLHADQPINYVIHYGGTINASSGGPPIGVVVDGSSRPMSGSLQPGVTNLPPARTVWDTMSCYGIWAWNDGAGNTIIGYEWPTAVAG